MKRLVTGLIAVIGWLFLLLKGPFSLFWLVLSGVGAVALWEYFSIILAEDQRGFRPLLVCIGLLPILATYQTTVETMAGGLFISLLLMTLLLIFSSAKFKKPFTLLGYGGFGLMYVSFLAGHIILLRSMPHGSYWLLLLTAITAGADTAAFYTGTLFGRTKLCPAISPGKTVEGFLGGLLGSVIAALIVRHYFLPDLPLSLLLPATVLLSCVGVLGDLTESILKRSFKVKDSGSILPGHGGVLDRIDSLLLTAPLLYYLLHFYAMIS